MGASWSGRWKTPSSDEGAHNGTLSADTVRQFYEQAEIDYEELAELIAELDMAGPMKALLTPYGEKAEALLRLLP